MLSKFVYLTALWNWALVLKTLWRFGHLHCNHPLRKVRILIKIRKVASLVSFFIFTEWIMQRIFIKVVCFAVWFIRPSLPVVVVTWASPLEPQVPSSHEPGKHPVTQTHSNCLLLPSGSSKITNIKTPCCYRHLSCCLHLGHVPRIQ